MFHVILAGEGIINCHRLVEHFFVKKIRNQNIQQECNYNKQYNDRKNVIKIQELSRFFSSLHLSHAKQNQP